MSEPTNFVGSNFTFGPPKGLSEDECGSIFARLDETGTVVCWKLSAADIEEMQQNGGRIWLKMRTHEIPPHFVTSTQPFDL